MKQAQKNSLHSGVIAFEHSVNFRSMQVGIEIILFVQAFTASLFHLGDAKQRRASRKAVTTELSEKLELAG